MERLDETRVMPQTRPATSKREKSSPRREQPERGEEAAGGLGFELRATPGPGTHEKKGREILAPIGELLAEPAGDSPSSPLAALGIDLAPSPGPATAETAPAAPEEGSRNADHQQEEQEEHEVSLEIELDIPEPLDAVQDRGHIDVLLAEASMLLRYGLKDKAVERLEELLLLDPENLEAYGRLFSLFLEDPARDRVVALARRLAEKSAFHETRSDDTALVAPRSEPEPAETPLCETTSLWTDEVDEPEYFDLAAELEGELVNETGLYRSSSRDELGGRDLQSDAEGPLPEHEPDGASGHYELGLAYRETGLLDDAIHEFQLAAKEPSHFVRSHAMLGLCFRERGLNELAVRSYRRGLESRRLDEEERLALLYDLAETYLVMEDRESAYRAFLEVYGLNASYRDVGSRLLSLEPPIDAG